MEKEEKELVEKKPKIESEVFKTFRDSFEQEKEIEGKIQRALDFMKELLGSVSGGSLRDFWDAKKLVSPLFKEKINPMKRNSLWSEYIRLGDEARQVKAFKDEQTAFSIEQIELAIDALEKDINSYDQLVKQIPPLKFPEGLKKLGLNPGSYDLPEQELQLLKTLVSRLDALRKEILATDMRISHKNKILKRLSKLGDEIFPKRKELIKSVSHTFISDVEGFVQTQFKEGEEKLKVPLYVIRSDIKSFQSLAKQLTLNTQAFTKTRKILSECWDKIQEKEKERQSEMGERLEEQKKNFEALIPQIEAFETFCSKEENQVRAKVLEESNALQDAMKDVSLNREQVKILKDRIQKARSDVLDKEKAKENQKKEAVEKEINDLREKLAQLIKNEASISLEDLEKEEAALKAAYETLKLSLRQIHFFERHLADLRSFILSKKETVLSQEALQELYEERASHLEMIKNQMEEYRKEMGGSNLDFEKAMTYRELYDSAKIHFDNEAEALENLEEKL